MKSWWEFAPVNRLRKELYGDWEGMHATPSEIAIAQIIHRALDDALATEPPNKLSPAFIEAHGGDKHEPPAEHRVAFPDGRVGSHSALARPEHGLALKNAAIATVRMMIWTLWAARVQCAGQGPETPAAGHHTQPKPHDLPAPARATTRRLPRW